MQICRLADLADPDARSFQVGEGDWPLRAFLVRRGTLVRAYVNRCPHAGHPLNLRPDQFLRADGEEIVCRSHAAMFRLDDGLCTAGPCPGQRLQPVPVIVVDGWIRLADSFRLDDYDP
jgi:nitrite reductase/ring-hydroxylating ferredoxin subunit